MAKRSETPAPEVDVKPTEGVLVNADIARMKLSENKTIQKLVLAMTLVNENFLANHRCDDGSGRGGGCSFHKRANEVKRLLDSIVVFDDK